MKIDLLPSEQAALRGLASRRSQSLTSAERDLETIRLIAATIVQRSGAPDDVEFELNADQSALVQVQREEAQ